MTEIKVGQVWECKNKKHSAADRLILYADEESVFYEYLYVDNKNNNKERSHVSVSYFLQYFQLKKEKVKAQTKFIPVGYHRDDVSKSPVIMNWSWHETKERALTFEHERYIVIDVIKVKWEGEVP